MWIAAVATVSLAVFFLDDVLRATQEGPRITIAAASAPGLEPGSTVWVAGQPVGRVLDVLFRPPAAASHDNVIIRGVLQRTVGDVIRADASVSIRPSDLLAPVVVSIRPGTPSLPPFDFSDTLRVVSEALDQEYVLELLDSLRAAGTQLSDRAGRLDRMLDGSSGTLSALVADESLRAALRRDLARLRDLLARDLEAGTLGRLLTDSLMPARMDSVRARLATFSEAAGEGEEERTRLETLARNLDGLMTRIAGLEARLDAGEGTAGRALRDREIQDQMALLRARLDSVVAELSARPDRWLRFRIF
jgi:ABC-type transporter Mla subunit MlaD